MYRHQTPATTGVGLLGLCIVCEHNKNRLGAEPRETAGLLDVQLAAEGGLITNQAGQILGCESQHKHPEIRNRRLTKEAAVAAATKATAVSPFCHCNPLLMVKKETELEGIGSTRQP